MPSKQASKRAKERERGGIMGGVGWGGGGGGVDSVPFFLALRILVFAHQCTCGIQFACASVKV